MSLRPIQAVAAAILLAPALASAQSAHGGHGMMHGGDIGAPGAAAKASRTVEITMRDNYFEPEEIPVAAGETVRFNVVNAGTLVHEFSIGTPEAHEEHGPMMQMLVDHGVLMSDRIDRDAAKAMESSMGHGMHMDKNAVLLAPGESGEVVWTFPKDGVLEFACNVPGHYDSGMVGEMPIQGDHSALR